MKAKAIAVLLLACLTAQAAPALRYALNRTTGLLSLSWQAQAGKLYEVVRIDSVTGYTSKIVATNSTTNGVITVTFKPGQSGDSDEPQFSGAGWYYVVEQ